MPKLIFENLSTEQAETLAHWFEGQGEQDCGIWFEEGDVPSPTADVHHDPCIETLANGDVVLWCRTP